MTKQRVESSEHVARSFEAAWYSNWRG